MNTNESLPFIWITEHAKARLHEHHEHVDNTNVRAMLKRAIPIDRECAAPFTGRPLEAVQDTYLLAADRMGLFVIVERENTKRPGESWYSLVTYIRFGAEQAAVAARLWPVAGSGAKAAA